MSVLVTNLTTEVTPCLEQTCLPTQWIDITTTATANNSSISPISLCTLGYCNLVNRTLAITFMVILAFTIVVGNTITLVVFLRTRHFRTPQGYLKVSLALADMMVGLLVVPFSVYTEIALLVTTQPPAWYQGLSSWRLGQPCSLIGPVFAGCTFVSISTIFLMTVERSVAIHRPLHKDSLVTRKRTSSLIWCSWLGGFLLAVSPLLFSDDFALEYNKCSRMCNYAFVPKISYIPVWNIMLLFPAFDFTLLGGTLIVNVLSFSSIRRYSKKRKTLAEMDKFSGSARPSFSDIKAAKTIGILTFAFTASFSPIAAFVVGNVLGYQWCNFSFFAFWILASNSCCNVIIYSIRDYRFHKGLQQLFHRKLQPPFEKN